MFVIIWEYRVKLDRLADFENIYGEQGAWIELFQKGSGYVGTELLRDSTDAYRYITIDRWFSLADYESFLARWEKDYKQLDARCESLTESEAPLGKWETISIKTR